MRGFLKTKCKKRLFLAFWAKFDKIGQKGTIFQFTVKKLNRNLLVPILLFFKTKNQKIPMCGFGEHLMHINDDNRRQRRG